MLDVKTGSGAFMTTLEKSRELAEEMVDIGNALGRKTVALITDMNRPLGMAIGNGLEMKEAIDVLTGKVPLTDPLVKVCMQLGSHMLMLSGLADSYEDAKESLTAALLSGQGFIKLRSMLEAMGGDVGYVDDPELLVKVSRVVPVYPKANGYIGAIDARSLGIAAALLGAGRFRKDDVIDPAVGILMNKRYGDWVSEKEPFAYMYVNKEDNLEEARSMLVSAVEITSEAPEELPLIYDVIK